MGIVLVIIGLLLGGILKGQEMITQAKIKNVVADRHDDAGHVLAVLEPLGLGRRREQRGEIFLFLLELGHGEGSDSRPQSKFPQHGSADHDHRRLSGDVLS